MTEECMTSFWWIRIACGGCHWWLEREKRWKRGGLVESIQSNTVLTEGSFAYSSWHTYIHIVLFSCRPVVYSVFSRAPSLSLSFSRFSRFFSPHQSTWILAHKWMHKKSQTSNKTMLNDIWKMCPIIMKQEKKTNGLLMCSNLLNTDAYNYSHKYD